MTTPDPDPEILDAQRQLEQRRRELAPRPAIPGERMAGDAPLVGLAALVGSPDPGRYLCRVCRCMVRFPGICSGCANDTAAEAWARRLGRWLTTIPAMYRDASWDALPTLTRDDGARRVTLSTGKTFAELRGALAGARRVVLLGPAGSGKSTIAQCLLRERWERAPELRHRFIIAPTLREPERRADDRRPHPLDLALSADVLVLDELGAEIEGAQPGSGLLAQRVGPGSSAVGLRFDLGKPTIITTGLDRAAMTALYGDRVARRAFEGAVVIRLGGGT